MSFLKITDPKKRDLMVAEFLKTKKNIQRNQLVERLGEQHAMAGFTRQFKPITDVQKDISHNILSEITKAIDFPREYKEYTPAIEGDVPEMLGPIATNYMRKFASKDNDTDTVYGIYDNKGKFYIGDTRVGIIGDNIIVGEKEYQGTPGLWELITMKLPNEYDDEDYENYAEILVNTSALKRGNVSGSRTPKASKSWKWNNLLKPIWSERDKYEGKSVVILPSDAEALLDRLELLMASKGSGNTGLGNEIVSICDELKRQNVLDVNQYKNLMSSL